MISIIFPVYNAENTIATAIESIINQTYKDWELIIINDGSIDNSKEIALSFNDSRIKFFDNFQNQGIVYTLNRGLSLSNGEYIARMDSDDISLPERFEKQIEYLEGNALDLIGCMTRRIDMEGNCLIPIANKSYSPSTIEKCLKYDNCIAHPTWLVRKSVFVKLRGYRNFKACEDYDFLLRCVYNGFKVGICDSIQFLYRENIQGISMSNIFIQRLSAQYLRDNFEDIESISVDSLDKYLNKINTPIVKKKYEKGLLHFEAGLNKLRSMNPIGLIQVFKGIIKSKYVMIRLNNLLRLQLVRKFN